MTLLQLLLPTLSQIYVCTYEDLCRINGTRRLAANPTTTVCYLSQLLTCVRLRLQSATEKPKYCTNEGGVETDVRSSNIR